MRRAVAVLNSGITPQVMGLQRLTNRHPVSAAGVHVEKMRRLIWMLFANPDTSTIYGNVVLGAGGGFFETSAKRPFAKADVRSPLPPGEGTAHT